jgi:hypothetical protein
VPLQTSSSGSGTGWSGIPAPVGPQVDAQVDPQLEGARIAAMAGWTGAGGTALAALVVNASVALVMGLAGPGPPGRWTRGLTTWSPNGGDDHLMARDASPDPGLAAHGAAMLAPRLRRAR